LAEEYASRVALEARKTAEAIAVAQKLEQEEIRLIERLRKAQVSGKEDASVSGTDMTRGK